MSIFDGMGGNMLKQIIKPMAGKLGISLHTLSQKHDCQVRFVIENVYKQVSKEPESEEGGEVVTIYSYEQVEKIQNDIKKGFFNAKGREPSVDEVTSNLQKLVNISTVVKILAKDESGNLKPIETFGIEELLEKMGK